MPKVTLQQSQSEAEKWAYKKLVSRFQPRPPVVRNAFWAFVVGGLICVLGQVFINLYRQAGLAETEAATGASITLVFLSALLTGLGVYDQIGRFAGAGSIVPITGFANSIVAPALEFKREGLIFGVAARLFTYAGPVLVYGFVTSWLIGLAYYLLKF